jgi:hypothetical protein
MSYIDWIEYTNQYRILQQRFMHNIESFHEQVVN